MIDNIALVLDILDCCTLYVHILYDLIKMTQLEKINTRPCEANG